MAIRAGQLLENAREERLAHSLSCRGVPGKPTRGSDQMQWAKWEAGRNCEVGRARQPERTEARPAVSAREGTIGSFWRDETREIAAADGIDRREEIRAEGLVPGWIWPIRPTEANRHSTSSLNVTESSPRAARAGTKGSRQGTKKCP